MHAHVACPQSRHPRQRTPPGAAFPGNRARALRAAMCYDLNNSPFLLVSVGQSATGSDAVQRRSVGTPRVCWVAACSREGPDPGS